MSGERILVVDDEEVMRDVLMTLLSQAGYAVTLAENGFRAAFIDDAAKQRHLVALQSYVSA